MLQVQSPAAYRVAIAVAIAMSGSIADDTTARADDPKSGVVIDVNSPKRTLYPIAVPMSPDGDATVSREVATVASFDLSVAGVFKVLDPASFLADLKAEGTGI